MSENTQTQKANVKPKGLGRGLGSLLGQTGEGAFSKTTPSGEKALESLTAKMPSQSQPAIQQGFVETTAPVEPVVPVATPAPAPVAPTPVEVAPAPAPVVAAAPAPAQPQVPPHMRIWNLPIEKVNPNPSQPRQIFEKEPLQELASSIREKGILQPIVVRKFNDEYEIIAGERRWRAAQMAGLKEVPALLKEYGDQEVLELALIENIQRENLNPVEEAEAYDYLIKKYQLTQNDLAQKVGKDRVTVTNMLRILQLQPGVRSMVSRGELSLGQAKVLLGLTDAKLQNDFAVRAKNESLSVRALEKLVAKTKVGDAPLSDRDGAKAKAAQAVGEELQKLIGSKVVLDYDRGRGKISIQFYSDAELNQIVDTLRDAWRN